MQSANNYESMIKSSLGLPPHDTSKPQCSKERTDKHNENINKLGLLTGTYTPLSAFTRSGDAPGDELGDIDIKELLLGVNVYSPEAIPSAAIRSSIAWRFGAISGQELGLKWRARFKFRIVLLPPRLMSSSSA